MSDRNLARRTQISVNFNNVDVSEDINKDLISLSYTDAADGETDDLKIVVADREGKWIEKWLVKELENRDQANAAIASGTDSTGSMSANAIGTYTVTAKIGLNVRKGRGTGYARIGGLALGTVVTVYGIENGWAEIRYSGSVAYISASYLRLNGTLQSTTETEEMDGSQTNNAKYTKISAVIVRQNWDGDGGDNVLNCGTFELDNVSCDGPPQKVTMSASSLSYESAIRKTKKTRSWNGNTLKSILQQIAEDGGYEYMYLSSYNPTYKYMLQSAMTDIAFLQKLTSSAGVNLKVTDGILVAYDQKDYDKKDAVLTIRRGDGSYSSFNLKSSLALTAYSSCHVSYEDDNGNTYEATFAPQTGYSEGEVLEVTEQVSSNAEALELAKRRLRKENKGELTGSLKMLGDTRLQAGVNIELSGWGDFDGKWSIESATHTISKNGYTTNIKISKAIEGY